MQENNKELLPIGSVVLLKNASKRLMITGYAPLKGNNEYFDYMGCLYPEGYLSLETSLLFNKEDIEKIYCIGFSDPETVKFMDFLKNDFKSLEKKYKKVRNKDDSSISNDSDNDFQQVV